MKRSARVSRWIRPESLLELVASLGVTGDEPPEEAIMRNPARPFAVSEPGMPPLNLETYEHRRQRARDGLGPRLVGIDQFVETLSALVEPACAVTVQGLRTNYIYLLDAELSRALAGVAIGHPVATESDREPDSTVTTHISQQQLASTLARAPHAKAARVIALVTASEQMSFRLGRQPAESSRRTFETKYSLAIERGVVVDGLPDLLDALAVMGLSETYGCAVVGERAAALVVLDSNLEVVGTLYIELPNVHAYPGERHLD